MANIEFPDLEDRSYVPNKNQSDAPKTSEQSNEWTEPSVDGIPARVTGNPEESDEDKSRDGFDFCDMKISGGVTQTLCLGHWVNGHPTIKLTVKNPSPSDENLGPCGKLDLNLEVNQNGQSRTLLILQYHNDTKCVFQSSESSADPAGTDDPKGPSERVSAKYKTQIFKSWTKEIEYTCVRDAGKSGHSITEAEGMEGKGEAFVMVPRADEEKMVEEEGKTAAECLGCGDPDVDWVPAGLVTEDVGDAVHVSLEREDDVDPEYRGEQGNLYQSINFIGNFFGPEKAPGDEEGNEGGSFLADSYKTATADSVVSSEFEDASSIGKEEADVSVRNESSCAIEDEERQKIVVTKDSTEHGALVSEEKEGVKEIKQNQTLTPVKPEVRKIKIKCVYRDAEAEFIVNAADVGDPDFFKIKIKVTLPRGKCIVTGQCALAEAKGTRTSPSREVSGETQVTRTSNF
jgi:hypothetical protein